jgi:hypothetical protein
MFVSMPPFSLEIILLLYILNIKNIKKYITIITIIINPAINIDV